MKISLKRFMTAFALLCMAGLMMQATPMDPAAVSKSVVPVFPKGKWLNGTFSMSNWWTYDGKQYVGNPYTRSVAFNFSEKGKSEFYLIIKTNTGYCTTEAFTFLKGTVEFTEGEQSFTFVPASGNYRGFYSCASGSNFNRPAKQEELKPTKYYWSVEKDNQGQEMLLIRFSNDASAPASYFKKAEW